MMKAPEEKKATLQDQKASRNPSASQHEAPKRATQKSKERTRRDIKMQPGKNQEYHTMDEEANARTASDTDTRDASSSSISVTTHAKGGSIAPLKQVVYVDGENRQVTAWVSGLMSAATFKRYAKRTIKKIENREVILINDQTDGTKHVQDLDVKTWSRKSQEGQTDYCKVLKKSMYEDEKTTKSSHEKS